MRNPSLASFLLFNFLCALILNASPQKSSPILNGHENERRSFAINLLRALNTSEFDYQKKHGTYANWDALLADLKGRLDGAG